MTGLLANGGKVLVVGGMMNPLWKSFEGHPQVEFWSGDRKDMQQHVRNRQVPNNIRALIISKWISHAEIEPIATEARKKRATIWRNKNDGEVTRLLEELTHKEEPKLTTMPAPESVGPRVKSIINLPTIEMMAEKGWLKNLFMS